MENNNTKLTFVCASLENCIMTSQDRDEDDEKAYQSTQERPAIMLLVCAHKNLSNRSEMMMMEKFSHHIFKIVVT